MPRFDKKIGFIGGGNMGEALAGAMISADLFSANSIWASDISRERLNDLSRSLGIVTLQDNGKLFSECDIVVLAIKPQQMQSVLSELSDNLPHPIKARKLIISIAAGIRMEKIETSLYARLEEESRHKLPIVRVMPNTPALVLEGMSGMSPNRYCTSEDIGTTRTLLEATGKVIEFEENHLDAVTGLSGSGPAYVFYLVESMIEGGIHAGLSPEDASTLTLATLKGALALLIQKNEAPESLRKKVTSPGGTTEAALKILEEHQVKQRFIEAIGAATRRSRELSQ